jgi:uncharacterized protein YcfJ
VGGVLGGVLGGVAGSGAGKSKVGRVAGAAAGAAGGGALGYYGGRAEQVAMNRQTKRSFGSAGWKPISKAEYLKKKTKNRVVFPKDVIKSNFGY